jgi:hypothetical protein
MSDAFEQTLELTAGSFFLLPGAEYVTYFPSSGASRRIQAVVFRPGPELIDGLAGGQREAIEVLVKNSSTDGIASDQVNTGGDKIELGAREGKVPTMTSIVEILNQDAGMVKLKVI